MTEPCIALLTLDGSMPLYPHILISVNGKVLFEAHWYA